jgi:predicted ABC-type ATPase
MSETHAKSIYIIAGPNGAGKTTFATKFLPEYVDCTEFLNADLIAAGLSPFAPAMQNLRASELMLERMQQLLDGGSTFSFETTLAAKSYSQQIPQWRAMGYGVFLFFVWLPTEELAIERVANRVRQGGHDIPVATIRNRYRRGLCNFRTLYRPVVDGWLLLDGSQFPPKEVARNEDSLQVTGDPNHWQEIESQINDLEKR